MFAGVTYGILWYHESTVQVRSVWPVGCLNFTFVSLINVNVLRRAYLPISGWKATLWGSPCYSNITTCFAMLLLRLRLVSAGNVYLLWGHQASLLFKWSFLVTGRLVSYAGGCMIRKKTFVWREKKLYFFFVGQCFFKADWWQVCFDQLCSIQMIKLSPYIYILEPGLIGDKHLSVSDDFSPQENRYKALRRLTVIHREILQIPRITTTITPCYDILVKKLM